MNGEGKIAGRNASATRVVASTLGVLVGLAGIEHGCFEMLQGYVSPNGIMIDAIGPAYKFWPGSAERALTIIPNFLLTGILAVIFGVLVTVWAAAFVRRRFGALVLFVLSIILFLVGGGLAPIILTVLATATATRIGKPLMWWRVHLPVRITLAGLWPRVIYAFVLVFWGTVAVQIFGLPIDASTTAGVVSVLGVIMVALIPVTVVVGFAADVHREDLAHETSLPDKHNSDNRKKRDTARL